MSKARVIVLQVVAKQLTVSEAAARYGVSRQHVHRLLARYRDGGIDAVEPRSRAPHSNPNRLPPELAERVVALRRQLTAAGLDAGPETIRWHLEREGARVPSTATIRRLLHAAGLVVPEPRKRPRSAYTRFAAEQPNEVWQSDFTHWRLADGRDVEILNWLDDHARFLLSCTAHAPVTGPAVVSTFLAAVTEHGTPATTLTDNGMVFTARFRGGKNAFEYLLGTLGVTQKNGKPNHPQTQGKVERFHQTLKRWLAGQPPAADLPTLQAHLDTFTRLYNHDRPHRALGRRTPADAYTATPKAAPAAPGSSSSHYRIRTDRLDATGKISWRRAGRLHHLGIGRAHAGTPVIAIGDHDTITVVHATTGEILAINRIDPDRDYWRNEQSPDRSRGPAVTDVATHQ